MLYIFLEPLMRFELMTSSLPRKRSTPELQRQIERETGLEPATYSLEGCRSTKWAIPAFNCVNLGLQHKLWGEEDSNLRRLSQQIYSLPHLTALESPQLYFKILKNKKVITDSKL